MRIRRQEFFADILRDRWSRVPIYYCIVQRDRSNEILHWSQEETGAAAQKTAELELNRLSKKGLEKRRTERLVS